MRTMDLFAWRPPKLDVRLPESETKLHLTELKAELCLPNTANERETSSRFYDFLDRASARFNLYGDHRRGPREMALSKEWKEFEPKILKSADGRDSIFPPAISVLTGNERRDLKRFFAWCNELVPVDQKVCAYVKAIEKALKKLSPDEAKTIRTPKHKFIKNALQHSVWFACSAQVRISDVGKRPTFIMPRELKVIERMAERAKPDWGRLGPTNLVWRVTKGELVPCVEKGKYWQTSIYGGPDKYYNSCLQADHLPQDPDARKEQTRIIASARSAGKSTTLKNAQLKKLKEKYPPQKPHYYF